MVSYCRYFNSNHSKAAMKASSFIIVISATVLIWIVSCKHEIPQKNPDPSLPPFTTTNCNADTVYFQQQVLPIFVAYCSMPDGTNGGCHDVTYHRDEVILTDYINIMTTGEIVPGNPFESKAFKKMIDTDPGDVMPPPPKEKVPAAQLELIKNWIQQGAKNNSCQSAVCDSSNVTYSQSIKPILSGKCNGCHGNVQPSAGINLTNYLGVKSTVDNGTLWPSVIHTGPYPMPKNGPKLSTCELSKINKWILSGALNN